MAAVKRQEDKIDLGARGARDEMMSKLIQLAKEEIKGKRAPGEKAVTGQPPMNRTGNLRRSIKGEKFREGFATYSAIVGPTIIYGRAVEMGSPYNPPSWQNGENFPYMKPAFIKFRRVAMSIMRKHLV